MAQSSSSSSTATGPIHADAASSSSSTNRDSSPASSSSFPTVREDEDHSEFNHQIHRSFGESDTDQQHIGFFRGNMIFVDDVSAIRDDTWSCVIVVLTFWFFG